MPMHAKNKPPSDLPSDSFWRQNTRLINHLFGQLFLFLFCRFAGLA